MKFSNDETDKQIKCYHKNKLKNLCLAISYIKKTLYTYIDNNFIYFHKIKHELRIVCCISEFLLLRCFPLLVDGFLMILVCKLFLFSFNPFMTFKERFTTVVFIYTRIRFEFKWNIDPPK